MVFSSFAMVVLTVTTVSILRLYSREVPLAMQLSLISL